MLTRAIPSLGCSGSTRRSLGNGLQSAGDPQVVHHQIGHQLAEIALVHTVQCLQAVAVQIGDASRPDPEFVAKDLAGPERGASPVAPFGYVFPDGRCSSNLSA